MPYKPFLIAPYKTGLELGMPTWMIPKDAWTELSDAFLFRGIVRKRNGYSQFARLPHLVEGEVIGTGDGTETTFTNTISKTPIVPGSIVIETLDTSSMTMTVTDDGDGGLEGDGDGTINYSTGEISVTFNAAVKNNEDILATYEFYAGLPVMGLWNYTNAGGSESLMAFDTKRAFVYDDANEVFVDITGGVDKFTGSESDFFWVCNWQNVAYIANGKDQLYTYDGVTFAAFDIDLGTGPNDVGFSKMIFSYKGYLILLHTQEFGTLQPQRMRWSNPADPNTWSPNDYADADTPEFIVGAAYLRNDIIVFFDRSIWVIKFTGDSRMPFRWQRLVGQDGGIAQMAVIDMSDEIIAMGPTSLIGCDGNKVYPISEQIPEFMYEVNQELIIRAYAGVNEELTLIMISYPEAGVDYNNKSLMINYQDFSYSKANFGFTCWGYYSVQDPDISWDGAGEVTWSELERVWDERSAQAGFPLQIFGDINGYIWKMSETDGTDNGAAIGFTAATGWMNPFIADGKMARLGYVDLLVTRDPNISFNVELSMDYNTTPYYTETVVCDGNGVEKVWVRVYCGEVANFHRIRLSHLAQNQRFELHAMMLWFTPAGEIYY